MRIDAQRRFISSYQLSLMKKAILGSSPYESEERNFFSTYQEGTEYEAWHALERVGLAISRPFNDDLVGFTLTSSGLTLAKQAIQDDLLAEDDWVDPF